MLIIGIGFTQPTGFYAFQLFDDYSLGLPLLFIAFFQVVAVSWVYGNDKYVFLISVFISTLSHKNFAKELQSCFSGILIPRFSKPDREILMEKVI